MSPWNLLTGEWQPMEASERPPDQASGLRGITDPKPVRVIAVTSGKGGVGKTNVSVNLAVAMAREGRRIMLLDADLGLANVDVLLGLQSGPNLSHVIDGQYSLDEVIITGPSDVKIVPASSGVRRMAELTTQEHAGLINAFGNLAFEIDALVIDTAAGISDSVLRFSLAAQDIVVVVCDEPASITDAYALIKLLNREHGQDRFHVLANMTTSDKEGRDLFRKLVKVSDRFLDVSLDFLGVVPFDEYVRKAVKKQSAVVEAYPRSRAAVAFKKIVKSTDKWPVPDKARGHLEFFVERLVQASRTQEVEAHL